MKLISEQNDALQQRVFWKVLSSKGYIGYLYSFWSMASDFEVHAKFSEGDIK